jgi:hypothetical protein
MFFYSMTELQNKIKTEPNEQLWMEQIPELLQLKSFLIVTAGLFWTD